MPNELWNKQQLQNFGQQLNESYPYEAVRLFSPVIIRSLIESFLYSMLVQRDSKWETSGDDLFWARWELFQIMQRKYRWNLDIGFDPNVSISP